MVAALTDDCVDDVVPSSGSPAKMAARATLSCRPNSHPFQERNLCLSQLVKIGRSVAHARPAPNNAIFDCKVLSRNHAAVWYVDGKFYLQDTKSSNGTFVNNQRLSKGSEESTPREVFSGDIVQFGVDVVENTRKVTHGCIVATLKLYHPDGKEAKASPSTNVGSSFGMVPYDDLYQLNQYLNESLQREQQLEKKLISLQHWVENTRIASDACWKALMDEDRLLSRVENLENQLQIYSKNFSEDKLREELNRLQEDKLRYQDIVKESIQKLLQEKAEVIQKYQDLERLLGDSEEECEQLKKLRKSTQQDLQELACKYSQELQKVEELSLKLAEQEEQRKETCENLEHEKLELATRLEEQRSLGQELQDKLDVVCKDGELRRCQLTLLQTRISEMRKERLESSVDDNSLDKETDSPPVENSEQVENTKPDEDIQETVNKEMERLQYQLKKSEDHLKENQEKVDELHVRLTESQSQELLDTELIEQLEERLNGLKVELAKLSPDDGGNEMTNESVSAEATTLKGEIEELEDALSQTRIKERESGCHVMQIQLELDCAKVKVKQNDEELNLLKRQMEEIKTFMGERSASTLKSEMEMQRLTLMSDEMKQQVVELMAKVETEAERADHQEKVVESLQQQLSDAQQTANDSHSEAEQVKEHLLTLQKERAEEMERLRVHCESLEADMQKLQRDYSVLQEQHVVLESSYTELKAAVPEIASQSDNETLETELDSYRKMHADSCLKVQSLEEELVIVKERYVQCNEEMAQIAKELNTLREEYDDLATLTYAVPLKYLIPALVALAAIYIITFGFSN